jgi:hypothetical protein
VNPFGGWRVDGPVGDFLHQHGVVAHRLGRLFSGRAAASRFDPPATKQMHDMARRILLSKPGHDQYVSRSDVARIDEAVQFVSSVEALRLGWDGHEFDEQRCRVSAQAALDSITSDRLGYLASRSEFNERIRDSCQSLLGLLSEPASGNTGRDGVSAALPDPTSSRAALLTAAQRVVLIVTAAALVIALLVPPWRFAHRSSQSTVFEPGGFAPLNSPPEASRPSLRPEIDLIRLALVLGSVAVVGSIAFVLCREQRRSSK